MTAQPNELKARCSVEIMNQLQAHNGQRVAVQGRSAILDVNSWHSTVEGQQGYVKVDFRYAESAEPVPTKIQALVDKLTFAPLP